MPNSDMASCGADLELVAVLAERGVPAMPCGMPSPDVVPQMVAVNLACQSLIGTRSGAAWNRFTLRFAAGMLEALQADEAEGVDASCGVVCKSAVAM